MKSINYVVILILIAIIAYSTSGGKSKRTLYEYPLFTIYDDGTDPGEPLFLTPLINDLSHSREDLRSMARVKGPQFFDVESYSGFLTVDKIYNSNLFFWYFPAEENPKNAPIVVWLQGGPGSSSLIGLFLENGPLELISSEKLTRRHYSWSKTHNLIYIDSPVGTGFSFTSKDEGYARNDRDVARNLYEAVLQLYKLFEWSSTSDFWITGESFAGKYVPALAYYIHKAQLSPEFSGKRIPLKGLAIGNGLVDPVNQLKYGDFLYQLGLIDDSGREAFYEAEAAGEECIREKDMECAFEVFDSLVLGDLPTGSIFKNLTGYSWIYNLLQAPDDDRFSRLGKFLISGSIRRAIHVGNLSFHFTNQENRVKTFLKQTYMESVAPLVEELLKFYTVCMFSGQLDIIIAYPLSVNFLKQLKFPGSELYETAPRKIWRVDGELAGYVKQAGNLIDILVRNAGHMVPYDQPQWAYEMINHLTHSNQSM